MQQEYPCLHIRKWPNRLCTWPHEQMALLRVQCPLLTRTGGGPKPSSLKLSDCGVIPGIWRECIMNFRTTYLRINDQES
ncbi:hypothetical protein ACJIZ3_018409 [Penstemon smallii]|uniref:Uncharacterized protein n=1 Tax=Penstemon smallii TaxID=265156 RepID=A0ABD3SY92_9LAMI